jgi:hypothetical protein
MTRKSKVAQALVVFVTFALVLANSSSANAATKTITCYKGTAVKKVSSANPKCAVGWSTKKPVVKTTAKPAATPAPSSAPAKAGALAFSGTYKGTIAMLWSDSSVQATAVTATGSGNIFGLDQLTGSGSSAPASQCDSINGAGTISDGTNTLKANFDTASKGCAKDAEAPTAVEITGNAVITGGTGKYAGATGTLKVTGSFSIKSTAAGFKESSPLTLTIAGNITTK